MSYNQLIPLNTDSPGIFPSQARTNFSRLREIIEGDHQFNDSLQENDGYHNLIHLTQQDPSGSLAGIGRLYSKIVDGVVQLFYMDDAGTPHQMTPEASVGPTKIVGSVPIAANDSFTIFSTPTYDYTGYGTVYVNDLLATQKSYVLVKTGSYATVSLFSDNDTFFFNLPTLFYDGTNLKAKNNSGATVDVVWSLMINRVT